MDIRFQCPKCQAPLTAPAEMAGRQAKCPQCMTVVPVPDPEIDRWPPGMAPKRAGGQEKRRAQPPAKASPKSRAADRAAERPSPPQSAPIVAPPESAQPPPVPPAKRVPAAPVAVDRPSSSHAPTEPGDDIQELLDFEPVSSRTPEGTAPDIAINPYQSPASRETESFAKSRATEPTRIRFSQTIGTTWRVFKANLGMCVAGPLLSYACFSIALAVGRLLITLAAVIVEPGGPTALIIVLVLFIVYSVLLASLLLGAMRFMLTIARGGQGKFGELFAAGPILLSGIFVFLFLAVGTFVGAMALVVPGILFALFFGLAPVALVDQNTDVIESFKLSAQAMKPNVFPVFLILFVVGSGLSLLEVFTCGIALLVTVPFRLLLYTVIYLMATGQTIGLPASERSVA